MAMAEAASAPVNRTLAAAGAITLYAVLIGFTDNSVRFIAQDIGLWQFLATRTVFVVALMLLALPLLRLDLRPRDLRAVAARSLLHGVALMCYFAAFAFLPVAQAAAGLFTAPIFVLLIARFAYGQPIGPFRIAAVVFGFLGILMVLGPGLASIGLAVVVPALAGFFYALGHIATRRWCARESAATLTLGFFLALGMFGLIGMGGLLAFPQAVPPDMAGFVLRAPVVPSAEVLLWILAQAIGALLGLLAMVRGYQLADASRVAVFEYIVLPVAALWGFLLWAEVPSALAVGGMALIVAAGLLIALRGD